MRLLSAVARFVLETSFDFGAFFPHCHRCVFKFVCVVLSIHNYDLFGRRALRVIYNRPKTMLCFEMILLPFSLSLSLSFFNLLLRLEKQKFMVIIVRKMLIWKRIYHLVELFFLSLDNAQAVVVS